MSETKDDKIVTMPTRSIVDMSQAVRDAFGLLERNNGKSEARALQRRISDAADDGSDLVFALEQDPEDEKQNEEYTELGVSMLDVALIQSSPFQTRELVADMQLEELARSIAQKGVIQPILVRTNNGDLPYELIAGERRLRAAQLAGLTEVPAIIYNLPNREALELSIIENAQRENLNVIEEALAIKQLLGEFKLNQAQAAEVLGKSRAAIANAVRLLQLEPEVVELLKSGELSAGHGRALLRIEDGAEQVRIASLAVRGEFSVRKLESLVDSLHNDASAEALSAEEIAEKEKLERQQTRLRNLLDHELLSLRFDGQGRKKLTLTFESEAAWRRFLNRVKE